MQRPDGSVRAIASLDGPRLRRELSRRGLSQRDFAAETGLAEETLSRAIAGRPVHAGTLRTIAAALERLPVIVGVDLVLADVVAG
jgi:transcriptional regulator with XRE-family HTH domain